MWRPWTQSPRSWLGAVWDSSTMALAWLLPRRLALWAFIRVYVASAQAPGPEYQRAHDCWRQGAGRWLGR